MTGLVDHLAALGGWTYVVMALLVTADAVFPILPAELAVLSAGALAASGGLALPLVVTAAALGAAGGDCLSYLLGRGAGRLGASRLGAGRLGRGAGRLGAGRLFRYHRGRRALAWVTRQLHGRAVAVIVAARFLPGGRTASTLTAGFLRIRPRVFVPAAALGGSLWATYAGGLGYLAGRTATQRPWLGAAIAAATVALGWLVTAALRRPRPAATPLSRPERPDEEWSQSA